MQTAGNTAANTLHPSAATHHVSLFDHTATIQNQNATGRSDRGKAMRNDEADAPLEHRLGPFGPGLTPRFGETSADIFAGPGGTHPRSRGTSTARPDDRSDEDAARQNLAILERLPLR